MTKSKYDVAISFLSADEPTAAALSNRLSDGLDVFFYPRKQEDLAGKNGLEAMRTPFLEDSRLVVVLFRERWGETPWTRVEQTAIQEGCLRDGWQRLFFIMLDETSAPPKWLPTTYVRFNYSNFGLEQAIGAIKARVQEVGGTISPLTAVKRAELSRIETEYLKEKQNLRSPFGRELVKPVARDLFARIEKLCAEINESGAASIEFASDAQQCHVRSRVSLLVTLDLYMEPKLVVRGYDKRLRMGREGELFYLDGGPQQVFHVTFLPDMNRSREYGWSEGRQGSQFLSPPALADEILTLFIDLNARAERSRAAALSF